MTDEFWLPLVEMCERTGQVPQLLWMHAKGRKDKECPKLKDEELVVWLCGVLHRLSLEGGDAYLDFDGALSACFRRENKNDPEENRRAEEGGRAVLRKFGVML